MNKNKVGLSLKITAVFTIVSMIIIALSGILTYKNQMRLYKKQCEHSIRSVGEFLANVLKNEGQDFIDYQNNFVKYYEDLRIPVDFTDYSGAQTEFNEGFAKAFPGKTYGKDVTFEELPKELKLKNLEFNYERWFLFFEQAMKDFDVIYAYYMTLDDKTELASYITDIERATIADYIDTKEPNKIETDSSKLTEEEKEEYKKYMYINWTGANPRKKFPFLWKTWDAGKPLEGYQEWDNEWGHTYAYYTPLVINGQKLGIVATEIEVDKVNHEILSNALQQTAIIAIILLICLTFAVTLINRKYIVRIVNIDKAVREYTANHSVQVVEKIEHNVRGSDEISNLSKALVSMITEIRNYIKKLTEANEETRAMKELANRDSLTGIRNKTAYDAETKNLQFEVESGMLKAYGIAVVDLNYLKRINDNYGHDKGNIAIKKICDIVCQIFVHSPVFRIGGDEFAIVLRGSDLNNLEGLVKEFRETIDKTYNDTSMERWERVSAAIGYALYDPATDSSVENVFKRADAAMFKNKKEMKAVRTD